jgi:hypothetical protein
MNWSRGLFRLWLVASILWVALVAAISWQDVRGYFELRSAAQRLGPSATDPSTTTEIARAELMVLRQLDAKWSSVVFAVGTGAGVPVVIFLIGAGVLWAFRGFRP